MEERRNNTPAEYIDLLFERTDEDGILYIPGWDYERPGNFNIVGDTGEDDCSCRCRVDWNLRKLERLQNEFRVLYDGLRRIAAHRGQLDGKYGERKEGVTLEEARTVLQDAALAEIWYNYVRPLGVKNIDLDRVLDIADRWATLEWIKPIAESIVKGEQLEDYQKGILTEYMDTHVTAREKEYYCKYMDALQESAALRLGKGLCAYNVIFRARRLCHLFEMNAPQPVLDAEACRLAEMVLLHKHGVSREMVANTVRLRREQMEMMSEEELDEFYRPKKTNTRKSLAPLFVHSILKEKSNSKHHLRHRDILNELEKYPYEITLERKALSRIIHNLADAPQYAVFSDKTGVWVEQE